MLTREKWTRWVANARVSHSSPSWVAFWICFATCQAFWITDAVQCSHAASGYRFCYNDNKTGEVPDRKDHEIRICAGFALLQALPHLLLGALGALIQWWIPLAVYATLAAVWSVCDLYFWTDFGSSPLIAEAIILVCLVCLTAWQVHVIRKIQFMRYMKDKNVTLVGDPSRQSEAQQQHPNQPQQSVQQQQLEPSSVITVSQNVELQAVDEPGSSGGGPSRSKLMEYLERKP